MGWCLRDAVVFKLYRSRYTLEVAGAAGWLDRFGGFAQTLIDPGKTPTQWHEMQNITLDKAAHYALRSYTNILTLVNFCMSGMGDLAQTVTLNKRSVWGQVRELVGGYFGVAGCDSLGGIWLRRHYSYWDASERAGLGMAITLTNADWTDEDGLVFSGGEKRGGRAGRGERGAFLRRRRVVDGEQGARSARRAAGDDTAADGHVAGQAEQPDRASSGATEQSASEGNAAAAGQPRRAGAVLERAAGDQRGGRERARAGTGWGAVLADRGERRAFERAGNPGEGGDVDAGRRDAGRKRADARRAGGDAKPPKVKRTTGGKTKPILLSPGTGTMAAINEDGYIYITRNFSAVSPTWTRYAIGGITGYPLDFTPDPFSPRYLGTGTAVNGWLVSEREIVHIGDIFGTSPTFTVQHTFSTAVGAYDGQRVIDTERSVQNFVVCVSYYPASGVKAMVTTNGSTWSAETTLNTGHPYSYLSPGVAVSGKAANVAYSAASNGSTFQGYKYSGGSWAAISSPNISGTGLPGWIHIPWHNNDDSTVFYGASTHEPSDDRVYRADGTTRTDITPSVGGNRYSCRFPRSIDTCAINGSRVVICGYNDPSGGTNRNAVFASKDRGATWAVIYGPVATTGADYLVVRCAGDDEDVFYLLGDNKLVYTADFGVTLQDKRGNFDDFSGMYRFLNVCGG